MPIIVQKYGGSSVADRERIRKVAQAVARRQRAGYQMVVVVSAMGKTTDELLALAKAAAANPPRRELDMLLSTGERISAALLAIELSEQGVEAVSLTGSQCGIITDDRHVDARVIEVRPVRIQDELNRGKVVIVAGFQGMSYRRDITTLGRGGSDTTAVALAAALGAEACEIFSDVDGVLDADPRLVAAARRLDVLGYPEMQELACAGAKVLNAQAVEFAKRAGIALYARQTGSDEAGTLVRIDPPPPAGGVRAIAHREQMLVLRGPATSLVPLTDLMHRRGIRTNYLGWASDLGDHPGALDVWCTRDNLHDEESLRAELSSIGELLIVDDLGAVSLIGEGIMEEPRFLLESMAELDRTSIVPRGLSTSSFRISLLVPSPQVVTAVQTLHAHFLGSRSLEVTLDL